MLCQKCFEKNATISITQIINGKKTELNICEGCAEGAGIETSISNLPQMFTKVILDILKQKEKEVSIAGYEFGAKKCPSCGYSWEDFRKTGMLGCSKCYVTFKQPLSEVIKQVHGHCHHVQVEEQVKSKRDAKTMKEQCAILEGSLTDAIKNEEYEKAAEIRDKIRSLKEKGKVSQG